MKLESNQNYFVNCFLLTIPVMVWNLALTNRLPEAYQPETFERNIPPVLVYTEAVSRTVVFLLAFLMPLRIATPLQKTGLYVYIAGLVLYFASWLPVLFFPDSAWSTSLGGFIAPACTPVFWLAGIGLIGDPFYFNLPFRRWFYPLAAIIFLIAHISHASRVYCRVY